MIARRIAHRFQAVASFATDALRTGRQLRRWSGFALALLVSLAGLALAQSERGNSQAIIELQKFRRTETVASKDAGRNGVVTLINLNPKMNAWFLLTLDWGGVGGRISYHLENPDPVRQQLHLISDRWHGIAMTRGGETTLCDLWLSKPTALERAKSSSLPYAPLCDGRLYLRNQMEGHRTDLERVTDFLRDHVWRGESIIGFVRDKFYPDGFREVQNPVKLSEPVPPRSQDGLAPKPASVRPDYFGKAITATSLAIDFVGPASRRLAEGQWYSVRNVPGVYVSLIQPQAISDDIIAQDRGAVSRLDSMEASATDFFVAFDLSQFGLGFGLGTDHPRLGWSARVSNAIRDDRLSGPDGFDTATPLIRTGMVSPAILGRVVATFTGGFKREHGAFKYGDLATKNYGSHYGFIEDGVVFSSLQPGLATLYSLDDASVHMKTWAEADDALLQHIRFARQNGVPLIEHDARTDKSVPGVLVTKWGPGNWSGSADEMLRTLRAGVCLQDVGGKRFLIYGYFSTATPSAMAEVFRAYGCSYAMLLDMNALEHTYLAIYTRQGDKMTVQHLVSGMAEVDKVSGGQLVPRFIGFPDNRDFFYLVRRESSP